MPCSRRSTAVTLKTSVPGGDAGPKTVQGLEQLANGEFFDSVKPAGGVLPFTETSVIVTFVLADGMNWGRIPRFVRWCFFGIVIRNEMRPSLPCFVLFGESAPLADAPCGTTPCPGEEAKRPRRVRRAGAQCKNRGDSKNSRTFHSRISPKGPLYRKSFGSSNPEALPKGRSDDCAQGTHNRAVSLDRPPGTLRARAPRRLQQPG